MTQRSPLRIVVAADPELPVPPALYGGIERVIQFLVDGLAARGHEVTLFAHRDSDVTCRLVAYGGLSSASYADTACNAAALARHVLREQVDVVHSFARIAYLAPLALSRVPKFMSYQRAVTPRSIRTARRLFGDTLEFVACGHHMIGGLGPLAPWHVVPNGVPLARYQFTPTVPPGAPLVFLGRVEAIKGPHLAIEAARLAGRPLVIAGNIPDGHRAYFDAHIAPHVDGRMVMYIGPIDDAAKNTLLGSAAALLMPITWEEPFGIVMAEALACGTPVIGFRRGAVPEVVRNAVTGFIVDTVRGMADAVDCLHALSRAACRADAEARFSDTAIVRAYEALYMNRLSHEPGRATQAVG